MATTREIEERLDDYLRMFSVSSTSSWWNLARLLIKYVESEPVLADLVSRFNPSWASEQLVDSSQAPDNLEKWAALSFNTLSAYMLYGGGDDGTQLGQIKRRNAFPGDQWSYELRSTYNHLYILPLVEWMREELRVAPSIHRAIDTWVQRVEWFGLGSHAARVEDVEGLSESAVQVALHEFLFDQGFAPLDASREVQSAHGRVDFVVRERDVYPVELKLWRNEVGGITPMSWLHQGVTYPRDFRLKLGFLVLVCVNPGARLQWVGAPGPVKVPGIGGCTVELRIADAARIAASREYRERRVVAVDEAWLAKLVA